MFWIPNITTILFAWILESIILGGFVWFDKYRKPSEQYTCWLIRGLRGFIFIVLTVFSFVFIDTGIKIFLGIIEYGNLFIHLASIILTFILALQIIIGAVFVAPNRKGILTFTAILSSFVFLWYYYIPKTKMDSILTVAILIPVVIGIIVALTLTLFEFIIERTKENKKIADTPFYDFREEFKSIFNWRLNLILWAAITSELLLNLQGLSILFWLTFIF